MSCQASTHGSADTSSLGYGRIDAARREFPGPRLLNVFAGSRPSDRLTHPCTLNEVMPATCTSVSVRRRRRHPPHFQGRARRRRNALNHSNRNQNRPAVRRPTLEPDPPRRITRMISFPGPPRAGLISSAVDRVGSSQIRRRLTVGREHGAKAGARMPRPRTTSRSLPLATSRSTTPNSFCG